MWVAAPVGKGLAKFDCYLNDLFVVLRDWDTEKAEAALPLALHIVGRPVDDKRRNPFL